MRKEAESTSMTASKDDNLSLSLSMSDDQDLSLSLSEDNDDEVGRVIQLIVALIKIMEQILCMEVAKDLQQFHGKKLNKQKTK